MDTPPSTRGRPRALHKACARSWGVDSLRGCSPAGASVPHTPPAWTPTPAPSPPGQGPRFPGRTKQLSPCAAVSFPFLLLVLGCLLRGADDLVWMVDSPPLSGRRGGVGWGAAVWLVAPGGDRDREQEAGAGEGAPWFTREPSRCRTGSRHMGRCRAHSHRGPCAKAMGVGGGAGPQPACPAPALEAAQPQKRLREASEWPRLVRSEVSTSDLRRPL